MAPSVRASNSMRHPAGKADFYSGVVSMESCQSTYIYAVSHTLHEARAANDCI